jgi:tRNA-2-methylthio-N6-dimethylallyladenosine synthase
MHGCDNFCSYCVVPLVRGREKSREPEDILAEARRIVEAGYKEITLLGQNVNSYGKGLEHQTNFAELLRAVNDIEGDFRIRFMTSHPKDCTRELLETIADCKKVCRSIHLPVQSGSDRILREMNRRYTAEHYLDLLRMARRLCRRSRSRATSSSVFRVRRRRTSRPRWRFAERRGVLMTYSFIYSKREGTRAAQMEDQVPPEVSSRRFQELLSLQTSISREINASYVGKTVTVLFDDEADAGEGYISGRSSENLVVRIPREDAPEGFADVYLKRGRSDGALDGVLIK